MPRITHWIGWVCVVLAGVCPAISAAAQQAPVTWIGALDSDARAALEAEFAARHIPVIVLDASDVTLEEARRIAADRGNARVLWFEPGTLHLVTRAGTEHCAAQVQPTSDSSNWAVLAGDLLDHANEERGESLGAPGASGSEETRQTTTVQAGPAQPPLDCEVPPRNVAPAPAQRSRWLMEAAIKGNGLFYGLEAGFGAWVEGSMAVSVRAHAVTSMYGSPGMGGIGAGLSWIDLEPEWNFDWGLATAAVFMSRPPRAGDAFFGWIEALIPRVSVGGSVTGFIGASHRVEKNIRLGARLEAGGLLNNWGGGYSIGGDASLSPVIYLHVHLLAGL